MIIYVDWDEHDLYFATEDKLEEMLEKLEGNAAEGSREIILVNDTFDKLTPLAWNVDGEFERTA